MKLRTLSNVLSRITSNPYVSLLTAAGLFTSAGWEILTAVEEASIGVHHGIILFAIVNILKTIPEFIEGTEALERAENESAPQKEPLSRVQNL